MDYVVTGGAGAIGSRLVTRLLASGADRVVIVDDFSSGHRWLVPDDAYIYTVNQLIDQRRTSLAHELCGAIVFHLAAHFANQNSIDHPLEDCKSNGFNTLAMLLWAAQIGAPCFIYTGAGCSVGSERTPYQITKALGESYCRYFREQRGLATRTVRLRNSYGPGEVPGKYRNAIPNWIWAAMHDRPLIVYGDGQQTRDFVFVDDVVGALIRAADSVGDLDVGTGVQTSVLDVVHLILSFLPKSKSRIERRPARPWEHQPAGFMTPPLLPQTPLAVGIRKTIDWFKANEKQIEGSLR